MFIKNNNVLFSPAYVVVRDVASQRGRRGTHNPARACGLRPVSSLALLPARKAHLHRVAAARRQENGLGGKLPGSFQTRSRECFLLADPGVSSLPLLQPGRGLGLSSIPSDGQCGKGTCVLFGFCTELGQITPDPD